MKVVVVFFFQAEDGIRDLVRSRGLGDVYKRQLPDGLVNQRIDILSAVQEIQVESLVIDARAGVGLSLIHI